MIYPFHDLPSPSSSWHLQILLLKGCLSPIPSRFVSTGFRCFHLRNWCLINLVDQELLSLSKVHQVCTFPFKPQTFPPGISSPTGHKHETPFKFHKPHAGKKVGCKSYPCSYTVWVQKKTTTNNHKAKRHLQTLSLIYPFAIHLFKNVFAGHCCLASPFLAREESAPWAFHSLVHLFTVAQANSPVSQLHSIPAVPHSQQMGNPNTFPTTS